MYMAACGLRLAQFLKDFLRRAFEIYLSLIDFQVGLTRYKIKSGSS